MQTLLYLVLKTWFSSTKNLIKRGQTLCTINQPKIYSNRRWLYLFIINILLKKYLCWIQRLSGIFLGRKSKLVLISDKWNPWIQRLCVCLCQPVVCGLSVCESVPPQWGLRSAYCTAYCIVCTYTYEYFSTASPYPYTHLQSVVVKL